MLHLKSFCFNEFQQNTYLIYDDDGLAFIIDPGNSNQKENTILKTVFPNIKEDTLIIPYEEIESLLNTKLNQLEQLGYSFTNLKLTNIQHKKNTLYANLDFKNKKKREINSIILNFTQNNQSNFFPKGHLKQLNKKYNNKTFILKNESIEFEVKLEKNMAKPLLYLLVLAFFWSLPRFKLAMQLAYLYLFRKQLAQTPKFGL